MTRHTLSVSQDPREPGFIQDPYSLYAEMHRASPVFFWEDYGMWCVAGYDQVNALLRDRRLGRENRWGAPLNPVEGRGHLTDFDRIESGSLLEREPPAHTRLRTLVNRAFVSRSVERLRPRISALANELIDALPAGEPFDLLPSFATPIPLTVICELLGVPVHRADDLLSWSHAMCEMYVPQRSRETEERANRASAAFGAFLTAHIEEHRHTGADDLLSALIAVRDTGEKLTDDELISTCVLLLNAGHEATVHQTGNAVKTILDQGGDPRRFFDTPEAAAATVEEALRYDAPLHMFTRYAYEAIDLGPVTLKPGEQVALLLGAANRDPSAFEAPDEFRPGRANQKNVSFGAGLHFCIGAPLARLELQESLSVLFSRLPTLAPKAPPRYRDSYHFHGLESLMLG
ncbi:cytochrome P450 [uncultured Hoeflea sp.]|uniref:cytochrome P450 n=1 Tax=uncultured Hoeflea sp. TaxID=538666 RepID=UPI0030EE9F08|tara:strand:- start:40885 stop:42093 length:1209 start_codon:yes stop_codon:yes gene_type:complete